ncbi:MAG: sigma 54-interacting transcriptional regulator, partial [Planctomycetota bacterium]
LDALREALGAPSILLVGGAARAESHDLPSIARDASDEQLATGVARALEARSLARENASLRAQLDDRFSFGNVVTRDPALREVLRTLESVADTRATVLVLGETGTGKSMLARTLHQSSGRRSGPYVEVNCGALPGGLLEAELFGHAKGAFTGADHERAGRFEAADGGTIFLDEIDSAPLELQVKLLRVVQDRLLERVGESRTREVDVRIVAATNADLTSRVDDGTFREDLYWRLKVVEVELPPLRARARDLAPLAESFVARFATEYRKPIRGLSPAALGVLAALPWPGNVRQLENALERAVLLASTGGEGTARRLLEPRDLGPELCAEAAHQTSPVEGLPQGLEWLTDLERIIPLKEALEGPERLLIERALDRNDGRRDRAASDLGINRSTLFNKMRKYGLLSAGPDGGAS